MTSLRDIQRMCDASFQRSLTRRTASQESFRFTFARFIECLVLISFIACGIAAVVMFR